MNKRKPDEEFARINLSYITAAGREVEVYCPESRDAPATQTPRRKALNETSTQAEPVTSLFDWQVQASEEAQDVCQLQYPNMGLHDPTPPAADSYTADTSELSQALAGEQHYTILYNAIGHSYEGVAWM